MNTRKTLPIKIDGTAIKAKKQYPDGVFCVEWHPVPTMLGNSDLTQNTNLKQSYMMCSEMSRLLAQSHECPAAENELSHLWKPLD